MDGGSVALLKVAAGGAKNLRPQVESQAS